MTKISSIISDSMDEASRQDYVKSFSKRMLKTHLFIGSYQEKRFVEPLNSYRDVVTIDSDETEFIENLIAVKKKLKQELVKKTEDPIWIGITDPNTIGAPVGYNLWVVLPVQVFGKYWFKVKTVEFLSNEVRVKLEVVRSLKHEKSTSDVSEAEDHYESLDLKTTVQDIANNLKQNIFFFLTRHVTVRNVKESVIFISLLIGTIVAGGANIIKYLMEYLLELMRELSVFIKVCSPIIISCINLVGRTIYGLYSLIVTLWHGKPVRQPPVYNSYYNIDSDRMLQFSDPRERYNKYHNNRALPYRSSVKITPLDD